MSQSPRPKPVDPAHVPELARAVVSGDRAPTLATVDASGQPRTRPVSLLKIDGFTVYVGNLKRYGKTAELAANPKVEMCFMSEGHNQVRLTGRAEVVVDPVIIDEIFRSSALLRQFLKTPDNPEFILYKIVPTQVRYMQEWALEYFDVPLA